MFIETNKSLQALTSFGIEVSCRYFCEPRHLLELKELIDSGLLRQEPFFILGGGNNILFTKDYEGLLIKSGNTELELCESDDEFVWIRAGAGLDWGVLIDYCLAHQLGGLENLISIPGTVGASVYQNIGAYGVEVKDCVEEVLCVDLRDCSFHLFTNEECRFAYRTSLFKEMPTKDLYIYSVLYRLKKHPQLTISYGSVQEELKKRGCSNPGIKEVASCIKHIRAEKLPSKEQIGNAGSFFKNPILSKQSMEELCEQYPDMVYFANTENSVKVSAAWLIEKAGWKGKQIGRAGVYDRQALVLVNLGGCEGDEIWHLAKEIQTSVMEKFHIHLDPEVEIL